MPICRTKFHGLIPFESEQVLKVPLGLFGFPDEQEFLLLELPSAKPIVFVQSIRSENLCFITLPAQTVVADYQLSVNKQLTEQVIPGDLRMSKDLLCLVLLTIREQQAATANLKAPLVIDVASHRGMQVLVDQDYSHYCPLPEQRSQHSAH